jgi:hypothetical protein
MKSYIVFFSFISLFSAIVGYGFDGPTPSVFQYIFILAINLVLLLTVAEWFLRFREKRDNENFSPE